MKLRTIDCVGVKGEKIEEHTRVLKLEDSNYLIIYMTEMCIGTYENFNVVQIF